MSFKQEIRTDSSPRPAGPYSQGIVANGFVLTAGVGPQDPRTGEVPEGVGPQTRRVLDSISAILDAAGASLDDVVKVTVHLADLAEFDEFNAAYRDYFTAPYPVRTTVGSQLSGIRVEIDVMAVLPDSAAC